MVFVFFVDPKHLLALFRAFEYSVREMLVLFKNVEPHKNKKKTRRVTEKV